MTAPTTNDTQKPSSRVATKSIVRAPKEWLILGGVLLLVSYVPAVFFRTFWGYLSTYVIAVAATLVAVLALLEDQRRMRQPAYSLDKSFRNLGAALYGLSTVVVVSVIFLMAIQWVRSR
jgi:uncharacterized membrane protein